MWENPCGCRCQTDLIKTQLIIISKPSSHRSSNLNFSQNDRQLQIKNKQTYKNSTQASTSGSVAFVPKHIQVKKHDLFKTEISKHNSQQSTQGHTTPATQASRKTSINEEILLLQHLKKETTLITQDNQNSENNRQNDLQHERNENCQIQKLTTLTNVKQKNLKEKNQVENQKQQQLVSQLKSPEKSHLEKEKQLILDEKLKQKNFNKAKKKNYAKTKQQLKTSPDDPVYLSTTKVSKKKNTKQSISKTSKTYIESKSEEGTSQKENVSPSLSNSESLIKQTEIQNSLQSAQDLKRQLRLLKAEEKKLLKAQAESKNKLEMQHIRQELIKNDLHKHFQARKVELKQLKDLFQKKTTTKLATNLRV